MRVIRILVVTAALATFVAVSGYPAHGAASGTSGSKRAPCAAGSVRAVIGGHVKCLRVGAACATRFNRAYRRHGFVCVSGRLHRVAKKPPPAPAPPPAPPPPPPPPPAQPGHYKGMTSQNENFEFDVTPEGTAVTNLITGQINESCNPNTLGLFGGNLHSGSGLIPVAADSSFKIDDTFPGMVDVDPSTNHVVITGHFAGGTATGTLLETTQFTDQGIAYSCSSNPQTWTVSRVG